MEFLLVLFIFPAAVIVASIIGILLFKKWFIVPALTLVVFAILMFTLFNESFFIWVVVYTILSVIISLIVKFTKVLFIR
ncbi:DUF2651 family protein [Bacillus sp. CHD6a]|uniref:DUF2651 family protein n=1 Tax=Bacillus sp. CHD6a TaxID=1643452 RepID=UPI0006CCBD39|nr:DUF2651 family protein [Bacillus sp. CHD6a]KPB06239.1 hypothetical protein AAV98_00010 [Bacillus sp. CHD6a]